MRSRICTLLRESSSVLVVSHVNPDGDAIGSSCGLTLTLQSLGKRVTNYNETGVHQRYRFIPGASEVTTDYPTESFDVIVVCDSAELSRVGDRSAELMAPHPCIINLDHHISNNGYGLLSWVEPEATSTCEVLVPLVSHLLMERGWSKEIATSLLTGIVSDTGSFRYRSTTPEALETAAALMRYGAELSSITIALFSEQTLARVRLQALALSEVTLHLEDKVALIEVTEEHYRQTHSDPDDTEGLAEQARDISGVQVGVLVRWHDDRWRISLRAKPEHLDLSRIAQLFGGGGHKAAAAFRYSGSLDDLKERLLLALSGALS